MKKQLLTLAACLAVVGGAQAQFQSFGTAPAGSSLTFEVWSGEINTDTRWDNDTVYILSDLVFINNGATLTIEPGTIIRGIDNVLGQQASPGALIAARGGTLIANGTADDPIIFTSIDDTNVPGGALTIPASFVNDAGTTRTEGVDYGLSDYAPDGPTDDNAFNKQQLWGGVVILGNSWVSQGTGSLSFPYGASDLAFNSTNFETGDPANVGQDFIEGIDAFFLTTNGYSANTLALYGGVDGADDSGVMRFCSIRYSGFVIGAANEINSLTTGGAGSGTVFEFVECTFNFDDGFEFFGGTNNSRHLFSLYNGDDSFDGDEGYRGTGQFWYVLQQGDTPRNRAGYTGPGNGTDVGTLGQSGDHPFEFDGPEGSNPGDPQTEWQVFSASLLANSSADFFDVDGSSSLNAWEFYNMALAGGDTSFVWEWDGSGGVDWDNFYHFADANLATDEFDDGGGVNPALGTYTEELSSPYVADGRYTKNGLDPRLNSTTGADVAASGVTPAGSEFAAVDYAGYQRDNTMLSGWSQLEYLELLPASNIARPEVSLSLNASDEPVVEFTAAASPVDGTRSVIYVIERSTDQIDWEPVDATARAAGLVTFTDTSVTVGSGDEYFYRVYAL